MTPLTPSVRCGVVTSISRYARRCSAVPGTPAAASRVFIVDTLSSAASIPLPERTRSAAVPVKLVMA